MAAALSVNALQDIMAVAVSSAVSVLLREPCRNNGTCELINDLDVVTSVCAMKASVEQTVMCMNTCK